MRPGFRFGRRQPPRGPRGDRRPFSGA
jgi:hypothetical protein